MIMKFVIVKKIAILSALVVILLTAAVVGFYLKGNKNNQINSKKRIVAIEDLKAEIKKLKRINTFPENTKIDPKDYPIVLGIYSENGLVLIEKYFCSDLCPENGGVSIVFQGINSKKECAKIDGQDLIDPAWGGYIGCAPKIN